MYEPVVRDVVKMGRHGQPMSVRKAFPISRTAVVVGMDARRLLVDWDEMRPTGKTLALRSVNVSNIRAGVVEVRDLKVATA